MSKKNPCSFCYVGFIPQDAADERVDLYEMDDETRHLNECSARHVKDSIVSFYCCPNCGKCLDEVKIKINKTGEKFAGASEYRIKVGRAISWEDAAGKEFDLPEGENL